VQQKRQNQIRNQQAADKKSDHRNQ